MQAGGRQREDDVPGLHAVRPEDGVVDTEARVHGLQGLRLVGPGIMPRITTGNLSAPTYMIAEKIAHQIRQEQKAGARRAA